MIGALAGCGSPIHGQSSEVDVSSDDTSSSADADEDG